MIGSNATEKECCKRQAEHSAVRCISRKRSTPAAYGERIWRSRLGQVAGPGRAERVAGRRISPEPGVHRVQDAARSRYVEQAC